MNWIEIMNMYLTRKSLSRLVRIVGITLTVGLNWQILAQDGVAGATSTDGAAGATSYSEPPETSSYDTEREDQF